MKLNQLIPTTYVDNHGSVVLDHYCSLIKKNCSQFLEQSENLPLYKGLKKNEQFTKLKARLRSSKQTFNPIFNDAIGSTPNLRERAIYAHGVIQEYSDHSTYFLFPIDGFKFAYNSQITDSSIYQTVFEAVHDVDVFTEMLKYNYVNQDLPAAIQCGAEILFHHIPYCYAIKLENDITYNDILTQIHHV